MSGEDAFPRRLTDVELKVLDWVLPEGRPGYEEYRNCLRVWEVSGARRWDEGSFFLTPKGTAPDCEAPPEPIIALGSIGVAAGSRAVIVREMLGSQVECEIAGGGRDLTSEEFEQSPRWRLSAWIPSAGCPVCGRNPREVVMRTETESSLTLAVCTEDKRLWMFDEKSGMNIPLPVTGFYNELMLQGRIQDPLIVLQAGKLFSDLDRYTDSALIRAFAAYNRNKGRLKLDRPIVVPAEVTASRFRRMIARVFRLRST